MDMAQEGREEVVTHPLMLRKKEETKCHGSIDNVCVGVGVGVTFLLQHIALVSITQLFGVN